MKRLETKINELKAIRDEELNGEIQKIRLSMFNRKLRLMNKNGDVEIINNCPIYITVVDGWLLESIYEDYSFTWGNPVISVKRRFETIENEKTPSRLEIKVKETEYTPNKEFMLDEYGIWKFRYSEVEEKSDTEGGIFKENIIVYDFVTKVEEHRYKEKKLTRIFTPENRVFVSNGFYGYQENNYTPYITKIESLVDLNRNDIKIIKFTTEI